MGRANCTGKVNCKKRGNFTGWMVQCSVAREERHGVKGIHGVKGKLDSEEELFVEKIIEKNLHVVEEAQETEEGLNEKGELLHWRR